MIDILFHDTITDRVMYHDVIVLLMLDIGECYTIFECSVLQGQYVSTTTLVKADAEKTRKSLSAKMNLEISIGCHDVIKEHFSHEWSNPQTLTGFVDKVYITCHLSESSGLMVIWLILLHKSKHEVSLASTHVLADHFHLA